MQNQGFIKLYRKILDSEVKSFGAVGIGFMCFCLLKANHKDNNWYDGSKFVEIKRGQFITSSLELARELKIGRQVVRRILTRFEELQILTTKPTNKYTLITLINYDKYQNNYMLPTNKKTSNQPTANQPSTINKNEENEKNNITLHRRKRRPDSNKKTNPEIKQFIDFFVDAAKRIRNEKPLIVQGKDGRLVKLALRKLSESQLEQLSLWFLEKKKGLATSIGAMLSRAVLENIRQDMNQEGFWGEVSIIYDQYYPRSDFSRELADQFQPFTNKQIAEMQEEVSAIIRPSGVISNFS